jgi:hypothetical protein
MDYKKIDEDFKNMPHHKKMLVLRYKKELDKRFDFNKDKDIMGAFFELLEHLYTGLDNMKDPVNEMRITDFFKLEIMYKTGLLMGLIQKEGYKNEIYKNLKNAPLVGPN